MAKNFEEALDLCVWRRCTCFYSTHNDLLYPRGACCSSCTTVDESGGQEGPQWVIICRECTYKPTIGDFVEASP